MPLLLKPHRVLAPGEAIEADPRFQKSIQSSTTFAYCGLLIRRGDLELAGQVLQVLAENKTETLRDDLSYLQVWMDLESKKFRAAKALLLTRVEAKPADTLALSLLQACLVLEIDQNAARTPTAPSETEPTPVPEARLDSGSPPPAAEAAIPPEPTVPTASADNPYQSALSDPQTQGLVCWDAVGGDPKIFGSDAFTPLAAALPELFPQALSPAVSDLEGGDVIKICFAFEHRTITTWHGGGTHAGLWSGPLSQSLLAMARVEKIFRQQAQTGIPAPENL